MKTTIALIACFLLAQCQTLPAPPEPVSQTSGEFVIIEYTAPGTIRKTWRVTQYVETQFPRTVTFNANGQSITLTGSYQINEFTK